MSRKLFGTDGIRGTANTEPMTAETALRVAMAAALRFRRGDHRHLVVIGKDTRLSGYMLEPAMAAGFVSMGMDVVMAGPMPTPAIAMLTRSLRADLGVMISASHNPFQDNGIKLFGPDGYKLSDEVEMEIEGRLEHPFAGDLAAPAELGRATRMEDARGRYIEAAKATFPRGLRLDGLKVAVDCANGAAYKVAPTVLWELGAEVVPLAVSPNGTNINQDCGATATAMLQEQVVAQGCDLGIALDGDADRVILVDEKGRRVDGDQLMALVGRSWHEDGRLRGGGIVVTVMSNLGLERFMGGLGLGLARTPVGDRYVVEHMREHGFNVGGEQSGHIVMNDYTTTGDGLIAALQVLAVVRRADRPVSEVCRVFEPVPQLLKNVRFGAGAPLETRHVQDAIRAAEARLGTGGRLLIRKSGTEPLIRVMAEGDDAAVVEAAVDQVVAAVREAAVEREAAE
jgi:phosphoglucosamine mutase